jgi:alpha-D-xyloside xylohydrolase
MPIFVRAGGVVPTRAATETVQAGTPDELTLRAVLPAEDDGDDRRRATFDLYDEDRDAVAALSVVVDGDVVAVDTDGAAVERVAAVVDGVGTAPATVRVDGEAVEATYHADADRLVVGSPTVDADWARTAADAGADPDA